ncbi:ABC transporter ATP-binding protein [Marinobacter caseinilyticus]|uniref:ABC transporter ATP-binding protein n=1 Tax=Marinobacter caseinilyticus TaxID=2692195 RepID=UPI00140AA62D|nr:ABC transporter ATP-binding protein [Marinobacter caseinilyticus]
MNQPRHEDQSAAPSQIADNAEEHLCIRDLHAYYGESHILHGLNIKVWRGDVVTLLGRNGAGRSTTLRAILGLVDKRSGSILLNGTETVRLPPYRIARLGIAFCPEERAIFASLNVEENLMLPPIVGTGGMSVEEIYSLFPNLAERRKSQGTRLSGGEQQMLAIARILRTGADLLLLDEITEGLAPVIVERLSEVIALLKQRRYTIVLAEQPSFAAPLADRNYIIEHGQVVEEIAAEEMEEKHELVESYLSV